MKFSFIYLNALNISKDSFQSVCFVVLEQGRKINNILNPQMVSISTPPPPPPSRNPWFEHRPQWWKTRAITTMPFETGSYLTKHEVVLFLFRCHYSLQRVCYGTMVSEVSSAYNCYPLTIPYKYSGKFRFSRKKRFLLSCKFLLALCLNNLLKVCYVLTLIQLPAQFHNHGQKKSLKCFVL